MWNAKPESKLGVTYSPLGEVKIGLVRAYGTLQSEKNDVKFSVLSLIARKNILYQL